MARQPLRVGANCSIELIRSHQANQPILMHAGDGGLRGVRAAMDYMGQ